MDNTTSPASLITDSIGEPIQQTTTSEATTEDNQNQTAQVATEPLATKPSPSQEDNEVLTPEKRAELRAKLHASKEEALRLKREKEALEKQLQELIQSQGGDIPVNDADLAYFKALAKKAGIPFKEEVEQLKQEVWKQEQQEALTEFLKLHPEYNKPGDPASDNLWAKLTAELNTYRPPQNKTELKAYLEKAHKIIHLDEEALVQKGKALGYAEANLQEHAKRGSTSGSTATPQTSPSQTQQAIRQGFASVRPQYYQ
jgi:hypothetical protein